MLSIITTCRVDNYEGDSIGRFIESVTQNTKQLEQHQIPFEYIVVEWNPINEYLSQNDRTKSIFNDLRFKDIAVDKSVSKAEGLSEDKFLEYYAKNVGVRAATYENILIINSDIILGPQIVQIIKSLLDNGLQQKFYRARYRISVDNGTPVEQLDLYAPQFVDGHLCAGFSGDFLLLKKSLFPGYDEVNPDHRLGRQTHMDGEILFALHNSSITLELINCHYFHLHHGKTTGYQSGAYNMQGYTNKEDWGFIKYPTKQIDNTTIIYQDENVQIN